MSDMPDPNVLPATIEECHREIRRLAETVALWEPLVRAAINNCCKAVDCTDPVCMEARRVREAGKSVTWTEAIDALNASAKERARRVREAGEKEKTP